MENELRVGGNGEGGLSCHGRGAQPCQDPRPQNQQRAGARVGRCPPRAIRRRGSGHAFETQLRCHFPIPEPLMLPLQMLVGRGGQRWVLSSGVPSPAVPLLCPSDAGQLPGILQAGEEGRKVH